MNCQVVIVGGGPAGLAFAIESARRGFSTLLFERQGFPCDKACGEGLLPPGVEALEQLGVRSMLSAADCASFSGIRYIQEDGASAVARFRTRSGLGIRRLALQQALLERAVKAGAVLREHTAVRNHRCEDDRVVLETDGGHVTAELLVAADGLHSPLRKAEGLDRALPRRKRYGLRQHFRLRPDSPFVDIYLSEVGEAYVTPAGENRVGVALLWEHGRAPSPVTFHSLLSHFPALFDRLQTAEPDSKVQGAGPLYQRASRVVSRRFALLGDSAGYIDAISGDGLSLSFTCALALANLLPTALSQKATASSLAPYERAHRRAFRKYAAWTQLMLAIARRPKLRRGTLRALGAAPGLFTRLVEAAT